MCLHTLAMGCVSCGLRLVSEGINKKRISWHHIDLVNKDEAWGLNGGVLGTTNDLPENPNLFLNPIGEVVKVDCESGIDFLPSHVFLIPYDEQKQRNSTQIAFYSFALEGFLQSPQPLPDFFHHTIPHKLIKVYNHKERGIKKMILLDEIWVSQLAVFCVVGGGALLCATIFIFRYLPKETIAEKTDEDIYLKEQMVKKFGLGGIPSPMRTPTRHLRSTSTPSSSMQFLRPSPRHHYRRNSNPVCGNNPHQGKIQIPKVFPNMRDLHVICPIQPKNTNSSALPNPNFGGKLESRGISYPQHHHTQNYNQETYNWTCEGKPSRPTHISLRQTNTRASPLHVKGGKEGNSSCNDSKLLQDQFANEKGIEAEKGIETRVEMRDEIIQIHTHYAY